MLHENMFANMYVLANQLRKKYQAYTKYIIATQSMVKPLSTASAPGLYNACSMWQSTTDSLS